MNNKPGFLAVLLGSIVTVSCATTAPALTSVPEQQQVLSADELEWLRLAKPEKPRRAESGREYRAMGNSLVTKNH